MQRASEQSHHTSEAKKTYYQYHKPRIRHLAFIFFTFVAGFLGAWAAIQTGIVADTPSSLPRDKQVIMQEGEVIADIAKNVSPSVVSVTTTQTSARDFFGRPMQSQGAGTGVIVSADGYVLTNKHVIPEGTSEVKVVTADGKTYDKVKVIGSDPSNDIAFLKIEGGKDFQAAKLGDSEKVQVGQKVVAIGNALGQFQNTVTQGIISGKGRPLEATDSNGQAPESLTNLFQTDAAINPGNSGGPLVNFDGEIIGINTAVAEQAQGIGFAIPINDAKGLLQGVLKQGRIIKPFLGVQYVMLNASVANELNAGRQQGALVYGGQENPVVAGSPADKAGIRRGDIITHVNGKEVKDTAPLATQLNQFKPGDEVELTLVRDGKEQTVKVTLEEYK